MNDRQEVIPGQLAELAGEATGTIGQNDFGFAEAARVEQDFTRGWVARGVLESNGFAVLFQDEIAQWYPAPFTRPTHMDQLLTVGQ